MTNKEIDKLLDMVSKNDLLNIKKYLLKEKRVNNKKIRQDVFEEYLTTYTFGKNVMNPKIYVDNTVQKFTNGVSLYVINKHFFDIKNPKLTKCCTFIEKERFNMYYFNMETYFNPVFSECNTDKDFEAYLDYVLVEYFNNRNKQLQIEKFDKLEIDRANIILENPKYTISHNNPVLKAESKIGKCYILGYKK